jgi:choline dehydrogenase-like flavoprotein
VRNYAGGEFRFTASQFCICLGTIESSRLLLNSALPGLGDQTGRYFHDHVGLRVAAIEGAAREQILERLGPFFVEGVLHTCKLEAAAVLRERDRLPAVMAHVVIEEPEDSGTGALRSMLRAAQHGDIGTAFRATGPMLRGFGDVARLVYASRVEGRRAVSARAQVFLHIDQEQVATADQRIRLSDDPATVDALGQRRAIVHWAAGENEIGRARQYAPAVREALERAGFPALRWQPGVLDGNPAPLTPHDTYHPMGGLRMGSDPAASVVTPELALHGYPNVHVASCATFPSGGSSNPTFTLMALTLRLADRLAGGK